MNSRTRIWALSTQSWAGPALLSGAAIFLALRRRAARRPFPPGALCALLMPPWPCCEAPQSRASCPEGAATSLPDAPSTSLQAAFPQLLPSSAVLATCACVHAGEGTDNKSWEEVLFFCLLSVSLILFCFFTRREIWKILFMQNILQTIIPALLVALGLFSRPRRQHA